MSGRFLSTAHAIAWLAVVLGAVATVISLRRFLQEQRALRRLLHRLLPAGRFQSSDDLVTLKRFLHETISYDMSKRELPRPMLRDSAATILARGEGFCGENARVAIRLLALGGVRANRFYLEGPRWSHVIVEHRWGDGWRLFDGHKDPGTQLADEDLGRIGVEELGRLHNDYREKNPWLAWRRLKLPMRPSLLRALGRWRPPRLVVAVAESPDLLRAALSGLIMVAGLVLAGALR